MESEKKTVAAICEEVIEEMCDHYCKWPNEPIPDGKDENWLMDDDDSPCNDCPLNRLL